MEQNEKNCQKAQELTNEELEQVNGSGGSGPSIQDILKSTTAILHRGQVPQVHQENKKPLV